jgi:hypothetical protein
VNQGVLQSAVTALIAVLILASITLAIASYRSSISCRKGKMRLLATWAFGSTFCIGGAASLVFQSMLPVFYAAGDVLTAAVHREGKDYRTDLQIKVGPSGIISVHATGRNEYFRPGQRLNFEYQGYTGAITNAEFYSSSGIKVGRYHSTDGIYPYIAIGLGALVIFAGRTKFRRDPEDAEVR